MHTGPGPRFRSRGSDGQNKLVNRVDADTERGAEGKLRGQVVGGKRPTKNIYMRACVPVDTGDSVVRGGEGWAEGVSVGGRGT